MDKFIVGLTGGIGSGKSAAADRFTELGVVVVDADLASRAVVEPGEPALEAIAEHFGADYIDAAGQLDRTRLRHTVFADEVERQWLQSLLHPLINQYLSSNLAGATSPYAILVNPLLIETRQHTWCQRVLVVDAPEEAQLQRTMQRDDNTREQVQNIMRAQTDRGVRLAHADDVIVNDQDLEHLRGCVDALHARYLELCQTLPA